MWLKSASRTVTDPPKMPKAGQTVKVSKPACLKQGYRFRTCKEYRSPSGILYDYVLCNSRGKQLKLQERGVRKYLSYNFTLKSGAQMRLDVHRVFAFSSEWCNFRNHSFKAEVHVHHNGKPKKKPWSNCTARNMTVITKATHEKWHRKHADVAHNMRKQ